MDPRRKIAALFVVLLGAMVLLVHVRWDAGSKRLVRDGTLIAASGDEPHYIAALNSILFDHDLALSSDYKRAFDGGPQLGLRHRSSALQHHTIVVDRTTSEHELWPLVYDDKAQKPCDGCVVFGRRVERFPPHHDLVEVPAHPVAFSAILAAAIAVFSPTLETTERDAGIVIVIFSWATIVMTYLLARRAFRSRGPALAAAGLLLCSAWLPYTRSYFSDPMIGFFLVAASLAMARRRIALAAIALSFAILLKPPFILVAAAFVIDCALKRRWRHTLVLCAIVGAFGLALVAFNFHLAGTPLIAGAGGAPPFGGFGAMFDTLFERDHGLISFVPWVPFAMVGVIGSLRRPFSRRTAIATVFFFGLMSSMGWGPSHCYGPRYWVPFLPWLAIEAVRVVLRARWPTRVVAYGSVALSAIIAISGLLLYTDSFSVPANRWW